jgi:hypothetical protein
MGVKRLATAITALSIAATAAGCGGSSGGGGTRTAASTYVHTLCAAISDFEKSVTAGEGTLTKLSSGSHPNLAQIKAEVTHFFTAESAASSAARSRIAKAGTPDVADGPKIRASLLDAFRKFGAGFDTAAAQSRSLSTSSERQFGAAVQKLQAQLQKTGQGVSTSLNGLGSSLKNAAAEDSICASIA